MKKEHLKIGLFLEADLSKPGGVQEYVRGLYDFLSEKGHEVLIIAPSRPGKEDEKRRIIALGQRLELETIMKLNGSSASLALTFAPTSEIQKFLNHEKFDIIHFQIPFGFLGIQLLLNAEKQSIARIATFLIFAKSNPITFLIKPLKPIFKNLSARFNSRIALSHAAKDYAQKIFPGEYLIIPGGVNLKRFNHKGTRIKRYIDGKKNILFVGRLDQRKGVEFLVKAFIQVKKNLPKTRLIIVGQGPEEKKLKWQIEAEKMTDVEFVGYVSSAELPAYYRTADIVCFPSLKDESFGIVLLEAMASGRPVVASEISGYNEVLTGDLKRLLVPPRDSSALAAILSDLIKDWNLRRGYGQKSYRSAQDYSWDIVGEKVLKIYQSALTPDNPEGIGLYNYC